MTFFFGKTRVTLVREREAEVRDPDTAVLIETFMVPDDLRLWDDAEITIRIDPYGYPDEEDA